MQKVTKTMQWQCKIANSLGGGFSGTPNEAWGTIDYTNQDDPTVFFGMYGLPDYCAFRSHKGKKAILWAGSDLRYFSNGWWIDDKGKQRVNPKDFVPYLKKFDNWVENMVEADLLKKFGIKAKVCPSFLGDVSKFKPIKDRDILLFDKREILADYPPVQYYSSVSGNDFKLYRWDKIAKIARANPFKLYILYGNTVKPKIKFTKNVILRGRVSQEVMDEEIKCMTGCIRLIPLEGMSELVVKAILWGQEVISEIPYKYNRETLLKCLNNYPWVKK